MSISFSGPTSGRGFWNFNIGHLVTLITLLGSVLTMVVTVQSKLTEHDVKLQIVQGDLTSVKSDLHDITAKLQAIAVDVARTQGLNDRLSPDKRGEAQPPRSDPG